MRWGFLRREEILRRWGWQEAGCGILEVAGLGMGGLWDVLELLYIPVTEFGPEDLLSPTEVLGFPICIKYREQNF